MMQKIGMGPFHPLENVPLSFLILFSDLFFQRFFIRSTEGPGQINEYILAKTGSNDFQNSIIDGFQTGLDVLGAIPIVGELFDGTNALITMQGEMKLSTASMVPFVGWGATGGKFLYKGGKAFTKSSMQLGQQMHKAYKAADVVDGMTNPPIPLPIYTTIPSNHLLRCTVKTFKM